MEEKKADYRKAGVFGELLFTWLNPLINRPEEAEMTVDTLSDFPKEFKAEAQHQNLKRMWDMYKGSKNRVIRALVRCYFWQFLISCLLQTILVVGNLTSPFLLKHIIDFIETANTKTLTYRITYGLILIVVLALVRAANALVDQQISFQQDLSGSKTMSALGSMMYYKCLRISSKGSKAYTQGKLMNLMQMDCSRVVNIINQLSTGINLLVTLILSMYMLTNFLGFAALGGVGICVISIIANYFIAGINRAYQKKVMALKDERMKKTTEALQAIKILKMYGWCDLFKGFISEVRKTEIATMQIKALLSGIFISALYFFPKLVGIGTFFIYAALYDHIGMGSVFATINVFNILADPLRVFPWYVNALIDAFVSGRRIQEFLESEDTPPIYNEISDSAEGHTALEINGCNFSWIGFEKESELIAKFKQSIKEEGDKKAQEEVSSQESKLKDPSDTLSTPLLYASKKEGSEAKQEMPKPSVIGSAMLSKPIGYDDILVQKEKSKEGGAEPEFSLREENSEMSEEKKELLNTPKKDEKPNIKEKSKADRESIKKNLDKLAGIEELKGEEKEEKKEGKEGKDGKEEKKEEVIRIALNNVKLKIQKGEFVFVIGEIGSGKSSLLRAIMGDLKMEPGGQISDYEQSLKTLKAKMRLHGSLAENNPDEQINQEVQAMLINKSGKFAYVEQHPWIQNGTIKDNILFMSDFNEEKYSDAIRLCELEEDINMLPGGDLTEIGERGINLSGGQKARVSMARAMYSNREIYLLDDPLSALDSNVKNKIFYNCIIGRLGGKTRILASHCIEFLDKADRIIVLDKGSILFDGVYENFIKIERFSSLVDKIHLTGNKPAAKKDEAAVAQVDKKRDSMSERVSEGRITTDEDQEKGRVSFSVYKRYMNALGGAKFLILLSIILSTWTFFVVGSDYLLALWAKHNSSTDKAYIYLIGNTIFSVGSVICIVFRVLITFKCSIRASKKLHEDMLSRIMAAPVNTYFDKTPLGRIINRLSNDLNCVDMEMPFLIGNMNMALWRLIGCFIVAVVLIYWCIVPMPIVIFASILYLRLYLKVQRRLKRLEKTSRSPILQYTGESYIGSPTIRAYDGLSFFIQRCYKLMNGYLKCSVHVSALECWITLRVQFISIAMNILTVLFVLVKTDYWNQSMVGLALAYMLNLESAISGLLWSVCALETNMVSAERCYVFTELIQEAPNFIEGQPSEWPTSGKIEFKDYTVRYRPETEIVLKKLNLSINSCEKIGVVGRTGSGKSTLCLSLLRILEADSGSIEIDGYNIANIGLQALRSSITIIPQDPTLFEGTLKFNLDPHDKYTKEQLMNAIEKAHLNKILNFEGEILDLKIQEGGKNMSAGERQLVCIVRAILRKNKIMLLDEATASMDIETEDIIRKIINEDFAESTMIIVAHRISTVMNCNRILVLDKGEVAEYDAPQTLRDNQNSLFSKLTADLLQNKINS